LVRHGCFRAKRERRPEISRDQDANDMTNDRLPPPAILIVEDDYLQSLLAVDVVERAGFVAIEASDADEAVTLLETRSDIVLVLTDVNMPGSMDGLKLAHAVRNRWPPIKIIVVSGQSPESDLPSDVSFLAKPYQIDEMVSEIRSLIGR
jgi:two-component system, response regulator PdtaR